MTLAHSVHTLLGISGRDEVPPYRGSCSLATTQSAYQKTSLFLTADDDEGEETPDRDVERKRRSEVKLFNFGV